MANIISRLFSNWKRFDTPRWKTRAIISGTTLLIAMFFFQPNRDTFILNEGTVWMNGDLYVPHAFPIPKSKEELNNDRKILEDNALSILVFDSLLSVKCLQNLRAETQKFLNTSSLYSSYKQTKAIAAADSVRHQFYAKYHTNIDSVYIPAFFTDSVYMLGNRALQIGLVKTLPYVPASGLCKIKLPTKKERIVSAKQLIVMDSIEKWILTQTYVNHHFALNKAISALLKASLAPSLTYNASLTNAEKNLAEENISAFTNIIPKGTLLLKNGEKIRKEQIPILKAYLADQRLEENARHVWLDFLKGLAITSIILSLLWTFLRYNRKRFFFDLNRIGLIATIVAFGLLLMSLGLRIENANIINQQFPFVYLAPMCMVPIVVSSFFDSRTSSMTNFVIALFGAVMIQHAAEYAFIQMTTGTVAVYSLRFVQKREVFFYTLLSIFLSYVVCFIVYTWFSGNLNFVYLGRYLIIITINIAFTLVSYPLIFLLEKIFGTSSDLSYLELLDTGHPLLERMSQIAPGTFQHSLQVANIAKAAIAEINGNTLLTYVGALYHDIGKMKNPIYFIENNYNTENPHNLLSPEKSAKIILEHVTYGVELAKKHNLPKEIIHFIETHHGTTRVEYFYRQQFEIDKEIDALAYTYKGPKPTSKETAVVMIADSIEAASRSLQRTNLNDLENLVNKIIDSKIMDNQLDNTNLTFKDINIIRKSIVLQLSGILHKRMAHEEDKPLTINDLPENFTQT